MKHSRIPIVLLAALACSHSDSFESPAAASYGPRTTGTDVQLTYNVDQNYWPTWTQDGKGILYAFVQPGSQAAHRCVGILPAEGGSRLWQMCDNRAARADSLSSYSAFALDSAGRLLLVETVSPKRLDFPFHPQLVLTDTATPYRRTTLLTLPLTLGGVVVTWLSDVMWTGPNTFLALGQQFNSGPHCYQCSCIFCPTDSSFAANGIVVAGTISGGTATLQPVSQTNGASGYALSDDRASIYFIRSTDRRLFRVNVAGGGATPVATVVGDPTQLLLGVTCRGSACIVASGPVSKGDFITLSADVSALFKVNVANGAVLPLGSFPGIMATPQVSPASGNVVVERGTIDLTPGAERGPVIGHISTFAGANSNLHLFKALLP